MMHREELSADTAPPDASAWRARMTQLVDRGWSWVWTEGGRVVFKAELSAWTPDVVQVQGVFTGPSRRGRGVATAGMTALCSLLLDEVPLVTLYVNGYNRGGAARVRSGGLRAAGRVRHGDVLRMEAGMIEASATATLPVTAKQAFAVVSDISNADWLPAVRGVRHLGGPKRGVGARFEVEAGMVGRHLRGVLLVKEMDEPQEDGAGARGGPRPHHHHRGDARPARGARCASRRVTRWGARSAARSSGPASPRRGVRLPAPWSSWRPASGARTRPAARQAMTTRFPDDTELDAIAAQVRSFAPMPAAELSRLLEDARELADRPGDRTPGRAAAGRRCSMRCWPAAARAWTSWTCTRRARSPPPSRSVSSPPAAVQPSGLRAYVVRVVDTFLDDVVKREAAQKLADALLVEQVKLLEAAEVVLRRRLEREPTTLELAAALEWTPETVEVVGAVLHQARDTYDAEIVDFLDDIDDADEGDTADI